MSNSCFIKSTPKSGFHHTILITFDEKTRTLIKKKDFPSLKDMKGKIKSSIRRVIQRRDKLGVQPANNLISDMNATVVHGEFPYVSVLQITDRLALNLLNGHSKSWEIVFSHIDCSCDFIDERLNNEEQQYYKPSQLKDYLNAG